MEVSKRKKVVKGKRHSCLSSQAEHLFSTFARHLQHCLDVASEKGVSTCLTSLPWLITVLPYIRENFLMPCACVMAGLHLDFPLVVPVGLHLRWNTPFIVPWFPAIWHNELRHTSDHLLFEVCSDVLIEPPLQKLPGEHLSNATANWQDQPRADINPKLMLVPTSILPCPLAAKTMRMKRREPMTKESKRRSKDCSLPSSFPLLEVLFQLPLLSTKDLLQQFQRRMCSHTHMF